MHLKRQQIKYLSETIFILFHFIFLNSIKNKLLIKARLSIKQKENIATLGTVCKKV